MSGSLHGWFEPHVLGERKARLEGEIPVAKLQRIRDLLACDQGSVRAKLNFDQLGSEAVLLELSATTELTLTCQRCLEPFVHPVRVETKLALVEMDLGSSPEGYETYEVGGDRINPVNLVEDELIVMLPLVPRHPEREACAASMLKSQAFETE